MKQQQYFATCIVCMGNGESHGKGCEECFGKGLVSMTPELCRCTNGAIGTIICPMCGGNGIKCGEFRGDPRPDLVFTCDELRQLYTKTQIGNTFEEEKGIGVLCGLRAASVERYPDDPDRRANWLTSILSSGQIVLTIDGIWHLRDNIGIRLVVFGEYA